MSDAKAFFVRLQDGHHAYADGLRRKCLEVQLVTRDDHTTSQRLG